MATEKSKNGKKPAAKPAAKAPVKPAVKAKVKFPEKFTAQTMIGYVAEKNEIPRAKAKEIVEDVFEVINAGVVKGERVPVGKFGKMFIKMRPATKARMGRNPITGEEIKIAAKKATKVPKFTFNKGYKEIALGASIKKK